MAGKLPPTVPPLNLEKLGPVRDDCARPLETQNLAAQSYPQLPPAAPVTHHPENKTGDANPAVQEALAGSHVDFGSGDGSA